VNELLNIGERPLHMTHNITNTRYIS